MTAELVLDPGLNIEHDILHEALAYYEGLGGSRSVPPWKAFSPTRVPRHILPNIVLLEVTHATGTQARPQFRWRLVGTEIVAKLKRDSTGRDFEELYQGSNYERMTVGPLWTIARRRPLRTTASAAFAGRDFLPSENLFLPFADADEAIRRILIASVYTLKKPE